VSVAWAVLGSAYAIRPSALGWLGYQLVDAARFGAWGLFVASLLPAPPASRRGLLNVKGRDVALGLSAALALGSVLAFHWYKPLPAVDGRGATAVFALWVCTSIVGLSACEQLYRQTSEERRWAVKPLCLALAALCGFDLFMFSDAMLLRQLDYAVWSVRGLAHAMTIPLVILATARNRQWTIDLGVSRRMVYGSLALLLSGVYLLAIAGAGYLVRLFGGDWGRAIQVTFLFGAFLLLALLFFSGTIRAHLRVFVSKHFFAYRYDYREEWLKFTVHLAGPAELPSPVRTVKALADLVESPAGALWLRDEDGTLKPSARWNFPETAKALPDDSALAELLERKGWIVEIGKPSGDKDGSLQLPNWLEQMSDAWLVIPLPQGDQLLGFVVLARPRTPVDINWEVRDLLKTAARQAAVFLDHVRTAEALAEARQFDAFNRMSAFVVHDLKNLVAQLSLMTRNAQRHGANPEFQKDMLETVEHVVERMNRLLLQLRSGASPVEKPAGVDVAALLARVCAPLRGQARVIEVDAQPALRALGHQERLERVVGHLLQNAVDATPEGGRIVLSASREGAEVIVSVSDDGVGMSQAFVREHLFKPFRSSKPNGMGIGAYESHEYVKELGGRIRVESTAGVGTRVIVHLPLAADIGAGAQQQPQEIAA
jgi:putative PEP-CTERM system histidine kinase